MKTFTTLALGACMTVALAGAGFAQSSMSSMTAAEKTQLTKCQGMSPSAMQSDAQCSALLKKYPDAAKGTTGSSSNTGGMNTGAGSPSKTLPSNSK